MPRKRPVPPDDDPHFHCWVNSINLQELPPPVDNDRPLQPLVAGLVMSAALAGVAITGVVAGALALDAINPLVAGTTMIIGCVTAGFSLVYLVMRV